MSNELTEKQIKEIKKMEDKFSLENQMNKTNVLPRLEAIKDIEILRKRFNIKSKAPKSLLILFTTMNILIGFMLGFSFADFGLDQTQEFLLNLDEQIVNLFGGLI